MGEGDGRTRVEAIGGGEVTSRVVVFHAGYGCDTGCCGHIVEMGGEERFLFEHPGTYRRGQFVLETDMEFVKRVVTEEFGAEHVSDIDWENVIVGGD